MSIETGVKLDAAIEAFTNVIHEAAYLSSPLREKLPSNDHVQVPPEILLLINKKRILRKIWQENRYPANKRSLNKATKELKTKLSDLRSQSFNSFHQTLEPTKTMNTKSGGLLNI